MAVGKQSARGQSSRACCEVGLAQGQDRSPGEMLRMKETRGGEAGGRDYIPLFRP